MVTNKKLVIDENGFTAVSVIDCSDESAKFSISYIDYNIDGDVDDNTIEEDVAVEEDADTSMDIGAEEYQDTAALYTI